ncbi:hypothetical protein BB561_005869 [Smittium simulii]|uniref:Pinin/SDK/MemA protein domain-containing protein n=1 Tax=Smittium simulii TaxID=133385 RepID=A0A2T9Y7X0_9FUNG|nr:hypothetical protein BB561_005869 [Smittium simulii]
MSAELNLSPMLLDTQELEPKVTNKTKPEDTLEHSKKNAISSEFKRSNKAAFLRVVNTLAKVNQDLQNKSEKQVAREELESKLRLRLFNERMQVLDKQDELKKNILGKKRKEQIISSKKLYDEKLKIAKLLKTNTLPSITFLPAKLLPEFQQIIDQQIENTHCLFAELHDNAS